VYPYHITAKSPYPDNLWFVSRRIIPKINGLVERYNRTMATQLRHYGADDPSRWHELLPVITMAYNGQPHQSTGITPFELVISRRIPNLTVRNLATGSLLANEGTLNNG